MSDFKTFRLNDDELTSPSSDEKMDTGSESFRSQDTPNSAVSSDFEDRDREPVLRLQNPGELLRFAEPVKSFAISTPKFSSTLTLTTNHPLMSPDENYPDLIPKKVAKADDEKDLSLSSIEDERHHGFYSPQRNTSKNNLYFTENFATADGPEPEAALPPDVARVDKLERRRIAFGANAPMTLPVDIGAGERFHTGVAEWCESPSHLRAMPNFELPIEMSSAMGMHNEPESPDVVSSSTQEDRSAYQALLDPYTGSVALRHTAAPAASAPAHPRRKILLPPEEDRCSLDSVSGCSMESEEEPEPPPPRAAHSDDEANRSRSTNTASECSEPIPEYSAAEELSNERAWLRVPHAGCGHTCDMKVIEPYKRVVSHGGYDARGAALIVFSACHLPDTARPDYAYVMDNLFLYVIWTLERLVTDEYVLVYLHGSAARRRLPTLHWLHQCYKLVDRRLRKSLKHLYLVHPTFWLKSFVILAKPFLSSKFFRKLSYVRTLAELMQAVPVEPNAIPDLVKRYDAARH